MGGLLCCLGNSRRKMDGINFVGETVTGSNSSYLVKEQIGKIFKKNSFSDSLRDNTFIVLSFKFKRKHLTNF
jgi:hypothetical protein